MLALTAETVSRLTHRFKRRSKPGAIPGTVVTQPEADRAAPTICLTVYNNHDHSSTVVEDIESLDGILDSSLVTWVDVDGIHDASVVLRIGEIFGLHPLALEDVVNAHQRAKIEMYGDYLFFVARVYRPNESLDNEQVAMFLGPNFVLTFQEKDIDCFEPVRRRIKTRQGRVRQSGPDYLLYTLIDCVVDHYFPVLESYGERLDSLDYRISNQGERDMIHQIHALRGELLTLRRAIWPLRDAIHSLMRESGTLVSNETDIYLRDCYDHTIQIIDVIETDREICSDLRDFYLTMVSNRMNEVMKVLTVIATFFMPLSFITGLYGMNFDTSISPWNMPELNWPLGYPFALGLMLLVTLCLLMYFRKKSWL